MNNLHRLRQIRRAALAALEPAHPYALPEETLLSFIDDAVRPPLDHHERLEVIAWLNVNGFAAKTADPLDPAATQWVLTTVGKTLLASL